MDTVLGQLFSNLIEALFGQALSSASGLQRARPFHTIGRILLVLLFGGVAAVSLFLWGGPNGTQAVWQTVAAGAPPWIYAAPALAVICALLALIGRRGFFWLAAYGGGLLLFAYLGAWVTIYGGGKVPVGLPVVLGFVVLILADLIAMLVAFGDVPALSDPLAHVAYLGRYGHLRALAEFGQRHDWAVRGPEETGGTLQLHGGFAGREVLIRSQATYKLSADSASSFSLSVTLPARQPLWPLWIAANPPQGKAWKTAAKQTIALGRLAKVRVYVRPPQGMAPPPAVWQWIESFVKAGAPNLRQGRTLRSTGQALVWSLRSGTRLTTKDAQLEPTLAWLAETIATLEELSARTGGGLRARGSD